MEAANKKSKTWLKRKVLEKDHLADSLHLMKAAGFVCWRQNVGAMQNPKGQWVRFGFKGLPDILGYIPKWVSKQKFAIPVFWECKRVKGRVRPEQKGFIDAVLHNGAFAGIGTSADLYDKLKKEGYLK